jgi:hypothetical protein
MYPFYLHDYKTTIWWSAKCGCSTIKHLIYNIILKINPEDFHKDSYTDFDPKYLDYTNILIVRNPIDRIISSYVDKYAQYNERYKLDNPNMNFEEFINLLFEKCKKEDYDSKNNITYNHHNTPQFSEEFNKLREYTKKNYPNFGFTPMLMLSL